MARAIKWGNGANGIAEQLRAMAAIAYETPARDGGTVTLKAGDAEQLAQVLFEMQRTIDRLDGECCRVMLAEAKAERDSFNANVAALMTDESRGV